MSPPPSWWEENGPGIDTFLGLSGILCDFLKLCGATGRDLLAWTLLQV
jgi:hypothetical protein